MDISYRHADYEDFVTSLSPRMTVLFGGDPDDGTDQEYYISDTDYRPVGFGDGPGDDAWMLEVVDEYATPSEIIWTLPREQFIEDMVPIIVRELNSKDLEPQVEVITEGQENFEKISGDGEIPVWAKISFKVPDEFKEDYKGKFGT